MKRKSIALFALFFVGYNLVLAAAMTSLIPQPQRSIPFGLGDWALRGVGPPNPQGTWVYLVSKPFDLHRGEVLDGGFMAYKAYSDTGRFAGYLLFLDMSLVPFNEQDHGSILGYAPNPAFALAFNYRVPADGTYALLASAEMENNVSWAVKVTGTLTAGTPSSLPMWIAPLAITGVLLMTSPGLLVVGGRLRGRRSRTKGLPAPPPSP
jgi:hypothetical protein